MKRVKPINRCVHDRQYLHQDAVSYATDMAAINTPDAGMGGGGDFLGADTGSGTANDVNQLAGSGLDYTDPGNTTPDFNINTGSGGAYAGNPNCNCGTCLSGIAKALSNLAPGLIKALGGSKTAAGTKAGANTAPTPAKPISTQQYVIGGVVVLGVFILVAIVASRAFGSSNNSVAAATTEKA